METQKQQCKDWLLKNAVPSAARTAAVGKYLVAFSRSVSPADEGDKSTSSTLKKTLDRHKKLHILYLVNDLLHHTKYHVKSSSIYLTLSENLQTHLVDLIGHASAFDAGVYIRHQGKINDLLDLWQHKEYYQPAYIKKLRETVHGAAQFGYPTAVESSRRSNDSAEQATGQSKDVPYIMPAAHGDSSMAFYDLPAANMMPHIVPNRAAPINPQLVKPLQFAAGPADEILKAAVKDLLEDVHSLYGTADHDVESDRIDIDALGQPAIRDETTGEVKGGEGYYGWSRVFCDRMKSKHDGRDRIGHNMKRDQSADRSVSPRKRRRLSFSESSSGRSRSRSRALSSSPSGSRSRTRVFAHGRRRSYSRSRSSSRRRRTSNRRKYDSSRSPEQSRRQPDSRSESRSYSPQPPTNFQQPAPSQMPARPLSTTFNGAFSVPINGLPIPPPPPPNYKGIWPPPPPPLPPHLIQGQPPPAQANVIPSFSNFVPPPPPPAANLGQVPASSLPQAPSGFPGHQVQTQMYLSGGTVPQSGHGSGPLYNGRGGPRPGRGGRAGWTQ